LPGIDLHCRKMSYDQILKKSADLQLKNNTFYNLYERIIVMRIKLIDNFISFLYLNIHQITKQTKNFKEPDNNNDDYYNI